ncbi:SUMF1/EgtB/PvdO family nonheme iron enzyme [bacterium]|nr:SUMF1/EgtB/PvdO family nonheme iron enzyme [bacterium]
MMVQKQQLRQILQQLVQRLTNTPKVVFDWVTIPEGAFLWGSDTSKDLMAAGNETPQRQIYLSVYRIMRMPVTNAQYKVFVDATGHRTPEHWHGKEIPKKKANHPVVNVSWRDAMSFCTWAGARLPSEAEWEKAARGTGGRIYPWGNQPPAAKRCNFNRNVDDTASVGSYPAGASPYRVMDMAGNVWEWVNDWYQDDYYSVSPDNNPKGPATGTFRVLRGGSWFELGDNNVRSAHRNNNHPAFWSYDNGFRCARSLRSGRR